ncbi:MAG: hypothetical protein ACLQOO_31420 [Terriglobia bacterium]
MKHKRRGEARPKPETRTGMTFDPANIGRLGLTQTAIDLLIEGLLSVCTLKRNPEERNTPMRVLLRGIDEEVVLGELALLRVCAAVCFSQIFFREAYQAGVEKALDQFLLPALLECGDSRINGQPEKAMDEFDRRYPLYSEAIPIPNDLGAAANVGEVFAKLLGQESNDMAALVGSTEFQGALMGAKGFLGELVALGGEEFVSLSPE